MVYMRERLLFCNVWRVFYFCCQFSISESYFFVVFVCFPFFVLFRQVHPKEMCLVSLKLGVY